MNFTDQEKLVILKAMDELIKADKIIHKKEVEYLEAIVDYFEWNDLSFISKLDEFSTKKAIKAVREMSNEKRKYITDLLHDLSFADNNMSENEKVFLDKIADYFSRLQ